MHRWTMWWTGFNTTVKLHSASAQTFTAVTSGWYEKRLRFFRTMINKATHINNIIIFE